MNKENIEMFDLSNNISYEDIFLNCDENGYCNRYSEDNYPFEKDVLFGPPNVTSDNNNFDHIKSNVMNEIRSITVKRKWKKGLLAAGFLLFVLFSSLSPFGRNTLAEIIDKLYFIPGTGTAVVNDTNDVYIIPKPIIYECNGGLITFHTITKKSDTMTIYATGNVPVATNGISIKLNGKEYKCNHSCTGSGSNGVGTYDFNIPGTANKFTINLYKEFDIPVTLVKAASYDDYNEIGPTCIKNHIGLTLVPIKLDQKIQFDILQHHTNKGQVSLYGVCDKNANDHLDVNIQDNNGKSYPVEYPESHMGTQSSFTFTPEGNANSFTVKIPELTLLYTLNNELTIPMPAIGETFVNKTVDLQGYKVVITKIVRQNNLVTVYVDTNYNTENPENINYFLLDMNKMSLDYYHWILNDQNATEAIEFYINPKRKKLTLYFKELFTILKGPWTFEISNKNY